jgi:hypothetical protein
MPKFIACVVCEKTGVLKSAATGQTIECPCCNATARRTYKIPPMIGQHGWTTPAALNAYYNKIASEETRDSVSRQLEIFKKANPEASNSQLKTRERTLHSLYYPVARKQYPTYDE